MSDQPDDLAAWEAEFGDRNGGSVRRRSWIIWVVIGVALLILIWSIWLVALLNPDNWRLPTNPTPPVTPWKQGAALPGLWLS